MAEETVFLNEDGVSVTSGRLVVDGDTYALRNITSVKIRQRGGAVWPVVVGAVFGLGALMTAPVLGILIIAACGVWFFLNLGQVIIVGTASGETPAFKTHNKHLAQRIVDAMNEAIAAR